MDPISKGKEQLASTRSCNRSPFDIEPFPISKLTEQCKLIKSGIQACYLLPTEKNVIDENPAVRRWTFGKTDKTKSTKTILIVGATGAGKSTLINTMVNFMLGVKWEDKVWFQITEEDEKKSQAKSQTSAITVYELETSSSRLRIIDTPGYGDTNGIKFDQRIAENLYMLFRSEEGIHEIEAVCLVVKASQNRLTTFECYIFNAILSLFGKDIERNIVVFITHSDGLSAHNATNALKEADVPCGKDSKGKPLHFKFNNRQTDIPEDDDEEDVYEGFWNISYKSMKRFFSNLELFGRVDLKMTIGVLRDRKTLEACVQNLQDDIKLEGLKQNELKQTQTVLDKNRGKYKDNDLAKDFTYTVDEPCRVKVPIQSPWWHLTEQAMCCTICEENCHYPGCWWVKDNSWCSAMKDDRCTVCSGKCHVSKHVKESKIYVSSSKPVKKTAVDLKKAYEKEEDIKKALHNTKVKMPKLMKKAYQCIMELQESALKKEAFSTHVHFDFLITKMEETRDDTEQPQEVSLDMKEKAQDLKIMRKRMEVSQKEGVSYWRAAVNKVPAGAP